MNSAMADDSSALEQKSQVKSVSNGNASESEQSVGESRAENKGEVFTNTPSDEIAQKTIPDHAHNGTDDVVISDGEKSAVGEKEDIASTHSEDAVVKVTEESDVKVDAEAEDGDRADEIEKANENETSEIIKDEGGVGEGHEDKMAKTDDEKVKSTEIGSYAVEEKEAKQQNGGDLHAADESSGITVDAVEQDASIHVETVQSKSSEKEQNSVQAVRESDGDDCKKNESLPTEDDDEGKVLHETSEEDGCGEEKSEDRAAEDGEKSIAMDESVAKETNDVACIESDPEGESNVALADLEERGTEEVSVLSTNKVAEEDVEVVVFDSVQGDENEVAVTEGSSRYEGSEEDGLANINSEISESPKEEEEAIPTESGSPRPPSRQQLSGVQKTEQPYDKCTTETKIAMEIREMREREEELKMMRDRQAYFLFESDSERSVSPGSSRPPSADSHFPLPTASQPTQSPDPLQLPPGPGYRVSSVFGHKGAATSPPPVEEEQKPIYRLYKESQVEREIRLARDREEELRKEKGLPPREDDSYIKPSQVKSSQTRVFSKINGNCENQRLLATFKIQQEIEEQTQREMALRETGQIQTISEERTDSKVASLREKDAATDGSRTSLSVTNGHSPGSAKETPSSPTHSGVHPLSRVVAPGPGKGISMEKFISSRGKEMTFSAPKNGSLFGKSQLVDGSRSSVSARPLLKVKRTVSVESKIHQEIIEMKAREKEFRLLHRCQPQHLQSADEDGMDQLSPTESLRENGQSICDDEDSSGASCPRQNVLIAQWEQRIQKSEGRA